MFNANQDFVSSSTFYNRDNTQTVAKTASGPRKINAFELMNFICGKNMA